MSSAVKGRWWLRWWHRPSRAAVTPAAAAPEPPPADAVTAPSDGAPPAETDAGVPAAGPPPAAECPLNEAPSGGEGTLVPGEAPPAEAAGEGGREKEDEVDDLLDLFTEDDQVNEELRRLAMSLGEVDINWLATECRQVAVMVKRRR